MNRHDQRVATRRRGSSWLAAQVVVSALVAAACHAPEPRGPSYWSKPVGPAQPRPCEDAYREMPSVELLDAGRSPRKTLRIAPESGLRMTIPLDTETSLTAVQDGSTERGTTCYRFSISTSSPWGWQVWPPDGHLALTPFGAVFSRSWGRGKAWAVVHHNVEDAFFAIAPRLPFEPVGVGARFRFEAHRHLRGAGGSETITYELVEMEGTRIALKVSRQRHVPRQFVVPPGGWPDEAKEVDEGLYIEDFWLRLDVERHPLPKRWPLPLGVGEIQRRMRGM